ncbi:2-oxoglutarate (2OG) and Fe(II)-dependent oxygenase superfamily protein [Melia azedarach]|uniref:2-oxoglutarate (2OG) and Fe(II)-dependent oxygenase superfamily protein n=1 Tax=Melia azedarach TaxID=155640 RepID=A0ACC1YWJ8_MELAZ|nr:2-oxoglutarate (2OG) and Fe(II)-dependent oxygenase superfamily protein [Melia azedarach]
MEDSLEIRSFEFDQLPSSAQFASQIESKNIPAVFKGCTKNWKAFSKWNPSKCGLHYLEMGTSIVEAMLSRTAPVFYGDIRSHERVPLPFSTFISFCKQHQQNKDDHCDVYVEPERQKQVESNIETPCLLSGDVAPQQLYLAQVPIMNTKNEERVQLENLKEDIETPAFLEAKVLASINLWMNNAQSKSSTHYDPHHNLLCIVAGCKQVVLWPPSASPMLYPMPIYGEASNHSSIALENPEFSIYPRAEHYREYSQKVILLAGDALFIPEGWFHQIDSDDLTIAVNFWWQSNTMSSLSEHMDAYYLRRILSRLTDKEMNQVLDKASSAGTERLKRHACEIHSDGEPDHMDRSCQKQDLKGKEPEQRILLHELGPSALQALHELVSLVHAHVNVADLSRSMQSTSTSISEPSVKDTEIFCLEDDPIAKILWILEPLALQEVCLAMAHNFPRTLEALILHLLSPVGAEVLTRKFDEMDQQTSEEDRSKFYQVFYGVFDDQFAAMDAILNGKESFALQAFKNVLDKYVGVKL